MVFTVSHIPRILITPTCFSPTLQMVHEETSLLVIKLCELFICDLTLRAWQEKDDQMVRKHLIPPL